MFPTEHDAYALPARPGAHQNPVPEQFQEASLVNETLAAYWLAHCGSQVKIHRHCRLVPPERIEIGDRSQIDEHVMIFAGKYVKIGCHVHVALGSSISGGGECIIDDYAGIGAGTRIITGTEQIHSRRPTNPTVPGPHRDVLRSFVKVGAHAVIFTNCILMPGVTVGEGAVVAAGSIVHHDLKPWSVYGGNPLVQIDSRETIELPDELVSAASA